MKQLEYHPERAGQKFEIKGNVQLFPNTPFMYAEMTGHYDSDGCPRVESFDTVYLTNGSAFTKIPSDDKEIGRRGKRQLQEGLCDRLQIPMFALDFCPACGTSIWDQYGAEECATSLITYCKACHRSLDD